MRQDFIPIQGVLYLFGIKSLTRFSYSFQTNHYPITITIQCLSSTTTTTTTTTTTDIITTIMLCRCQLSPRLLLSLLVQAILNNWRMQPPMRPPTTNRIGGWLHILLMLCSGPASSAVPPLATNPPPPPEPKMAPNQVGHLPAILVIFAVVRSLLSPWWTR